MSGGIGRFPRHGPRSQVRAARLRAAALDVAEGGLDARRRRLRSSFRVGGVAGGRRRRRRARRVRGRGVCFEVAPQPNRGGTQTAGLRRDAVVARRPEGVGARPELWVAPAAAPSARAGPGRDRVVALALSARGPAARVTVRAGALAAVARAGGCGGAVCDL